MHRNRGLRPWLAVAGAACLLAAAGCGEDSATSSGPAATLRITRNFGHELIASQDRIPLAGHNTLLRQLRDRHTAKLAYFNTYVRQIDGLRSNDQARVNQTAWVTNVNGIETDVVPPKYKLYDGDIVQWDLRDWYVRLDVRATVGAFPETFTRGVFGRRFPVRVRCEKPASAACGHVKHVLVAAGVPIDGSRARPGAPLPPAGNPRRAVVLVGAWRHWRKGTWEHRIDTGPADSGVFGRFSADGDSLRLLDHNGDTVRTEGPGTGLVAAMRPTEEDLMWLITGVDDAGVERAAEALDPDRLRDAFAVAVTSGGVQKLPLPPR